MLQEEGNFASLVKCGLGEEFQGVQIRAEITMFTEMKKWKTFPENSSCNKTTWTW